MHRDIPVKAWPCSYYLNSDRQWVTGRLLLTPTHLRFKADNSRDFLVSFHLSSINEIKKESSSFLFSSITVLEKDNAKHWFSSLQPNRNVVFTVLEHFWREQLLSPRGEHDSSSTTKGKELINLVTDSQRTMEDTTRVLHHQGQQFDNVMLGLSKIEADMATTDRMLSVLEAPAWWPFSGSPWKRSNSSKEAPAQNRGKEGIVGQIPVLFSSQPEQSLKPGRLTVLLSALEIADCHSRHIHRYERRDVDDIKVLTGHEISVRQRFIGKPDITYRLLSAKLPDVLPLLEMQYGKKMEFMEEAAMFSEKWRTSPSDCCSPGWQTDPWLLDTIVRTGPIAGGQTGAALQDQMVSESEAQEMRKILLKLKGMALEAEGELERQDEALDAITSSADRAVLSVGANTRRMRKLL